ncbi:MAG: caspase family protein [Clostridiales bacterium]|nr:caspase family protein [Clostridiales bacterium]
MRTTAVILVVILCCLSCPAASGDGLQHNRALLIGVDLFVSRESTYPSSANNVQDMYKAFQNSVLPFDDILIPEQPATSKGMVADWIREAFGGAGENDFNYLYISTHGDYDMDGNAVLLLSDGNAEDSLTAGELEEMFSGIAGTKIILMDACYSGAFIGKGMREAPPEPSFHSPDFKVLTSSGAMEASWYWNGRKDAGQGSFYFTQILIQGISPRWKYPADRNRDGAITLSELHGYLLKNHGASTPQVYPQEDDTAVFLYDPDTERTDDRSPVVDAVFSDDSILPGETLTLSFTALRPVRVAYQIVYRRDGQWQFDEAELVYDETERFTAFGELAGAILPGRKLRTVALTREEEELYGYVLVQLLSLEDGRLTVQTGHVIAVTPAEGNPALRVETPDSFLAAEGAELPIFVSHAYPCTLSVSIADAQGDTVKRLSFRSASRPLNTVPEGSCFYWDGRDKDDEPVPEGEYRVLVEGWIGDTAYTAQSEIITITYEEEER